MYQAPVTIKKTLKKVASNAIVLPAIQREFVWQPKQICEFYDSLVQGYPFGTFLYWNVSKENNKNYQFYDFVRDYHERNNPHCPHLGDMPDRDVIAVLDGQQRLTALNIGLRGSLAKKLPRKRWNNPAAFPRKYLHLDLLWSPSDDEDIGVRYRFEFLTPEQVEISENSPEKKECWFAVKDILKLKNSGPAMQAWLANKLPGDLVTQAFEVLYELYEAIRVRPLVCFYEESSQELEKVLQIFIRTNSGGTVLSYSDLLLSVAVAQWSEHDAREEIHQTVDEINNIGNGFDFSKDWVLKAGLMLSDTHNVGFKVENFNRRNMKTLENNWRSIRRALIQTVNLVASFGFTGETIRADSALLPIAYYIYVRKADSSYLEHLRFSHDREIIRRWLIASLLKSGIWGSGLDTLLTALRQSIKENYSGGFPVDAAGNSMRQRGKSIRFDEEEIDALTDLRYGDSRTFPLLSLIFKHLDLRNHFHIDHIFPRSRFTTTRLKSKGFFPRANRRAEGQDEQLAKPATSSGCCEPREAGHVASQVASVGIQFRG